MDGVIRMKLKPDSVPTIFSFAKPSKRRVSSIQREKNVAKKICLEQALQECETSKEVPQQATSTNMVNKAVECNPKQLLPKTKSVRTQYKPTDILDNVLKPAASSNPVLIKMNIPKKAKGINVGVNTELSFPCNDDFEGVSSSSEEKIWEYFNSCVSFNQDMFEGKQKHSLQFLS